ncbi:hypothetical protein BpHYR1_028067 [Brachionus plicatilis]|uniref:Uncharacterized protein n=1 Tax=Brachionus plicatilis TaxID=10195 RepID=A0A3M7R2X2_BRAPC|nr:hypothetical protein BpHYR1_028067 [Brachionus plicatilis]
MDRLIIHIVTGLLIKFNDIEMDIPLNNKPKLCLQCQPSDCIQNEENAFLESDEDSDIESEPAPKLSNKQKPNYAVLSIENICTTCNAVMKEKKFDRHRLFDHQY